MSDPGTRQYIRSVLGPREPALSAILRRSLLEERMAPIQIDDNAARVLQLLTMLHGPMRVLEVGTHFGYSTIHIARGLPPGGRLTTLELDPQAAEAAQRNLEKAGVADRVDIVVQDAAAYMATAEAESFGMLFIDADKKGYPNYLKLGFPLLEHGGLLVADDAFAQGDFSGESEDGADEDRERKGLLTYCRAVGRSPLLFSAFIGTENGLLVSVKE